MSITMQEAIEVFKQVVEDDVGCNSGEYEGNDFYIISGWDVIKKIEALTGLKFDDIIKEITGNDDGWGFSDEYTTAHCCYKIVRIQADSYGWKPEYIIINGKMFCKDCFTVSDLDNYLVDEHIINNFKKAIDCEFITDEMLQQLEYVNLQEQEVGFNGGVSPETTYNNFKAGYNNIIFKIDSSSQFDIVYSVWGKNN